MSTNANVKTQENGHWYFTSGEPCFEVPKADGKGMTKTTLRHAKKMNLLPSVTTILRVLDKPALTAWKIEQAVLAVMTTPRLPAEADDDFIKRVLAVVPERDGVSRRGHLDLGSPPATWLIAQPQLWSGLHPAMRIVSQGGELVGSYKRMSPPFLPPEERAGCPLASYRTAVRFQSAWVEV